MAQGITFATDYRGIPSKVTIDLKKYGEQLMDFFRSQGVEKKAEQALYTPSERLKKSIKAANKKENIVECENAEDMFRKLGI